MSFRSMTTFSLSSSSRFLSRKSLITLPHRCRYSTESSPPPPPSTRDPDHPHLYYHPLPNNNKLALSFLPRIPIPNSRTIIGFLPMSNEARLSDFKENKPFLKLLHSAIKKAIATDRCPTVTIEASMRPGDGYMHINDERRLPPAGRISETEDIIGSVFVQNNTVVPETYEPQPMYRVCTEDGVLQLPEGLDEYVLEVLENVAERERQEGS